MAVALSNVYDGRGAVTNPISRRRDHLPPGRGWVAPALNSVALRNKSGFQPITVRKLSPELGLVNSCAGLLRTPDTSAAGS